MYLRPPDNASIRYRCRKGADDYYFFLKSKVGFASLLFVEVF